MHTVDIQQEGTATETSPKEGNDTKGIGSSSLFITNNANENLLILLLSHTGLSSDICDVIISFLPLQQQLLKLNTVTYDGIYSIAQFCLLLTNNILHYTVCMCIFFVFASPRLDIFIPFLLLSLLESALITYFHVTFHSYVPATHSIFDRIITFDSLLSINLQMFVHIPMLIVLFSFNQDWVLWTYLSVNILVLIYRSFIYYRQLRLNEFSVTKYVINPMFYLLITALMMVIDGVYIQQPSIVVVGALIYYPGIPILCFISKSNQYWRSDVLSICNFVFLCVENIAFGIFGEELLFTNYDLYLTKIIIITSVVAAALILIVHTQFDNMFFVYLKFIRPDEEDEEYRRELSKLFIDFVMDLFVSFPMFILFLYYTYYNDDGVKYAISFDVAFAIYILHGVFRCISSLCYDMDMNTHTHDWLSQLFFVSLVVKASCISFTFALSYLLSSVIRSRSLTASVFLLVASIIFSCVGCMLWCLIVYVCCSLCLCRRPRTKREMRLR